MEGFNVSLTAYIFIPVSELEPLDVFGDNILVHFIQQL